MKQGSSTESFLREVMAFRPTVARAVQETLGREAATGVLRRLADLEASGGYITDPAILEEAGVFLRGAGDDLGFYVFTVLNADTPLTVRDSGLVVPPGAGMATRPVFLYWDEAIARCADAASSHGLPGYLVPWLHEFGHFICYCLQERPLMAAIAVLCSALKERGYPVRALRDAEVTQRGRVGETVQEMGRTLVRLAALNEAMAVWWEGQLLEQVTLDAGPYLDIKRADNPYIRRLEAEGREACLEHIRHWDRAAYHPEPFGRVFAGSFRNMRMDRWGFLG